MVWFGLSLVWVIWVVCTYKCEDILPVVVVFYFGFVQFLFWDRLSFLNSVGGDLLGVVLASEFLFQVL